MMDAHQQTALQNAFEFNLDDLAANRRGVFTDWQRRLLRDKQSHALWSFATPAAAAVFLLVFAGRANAVFAPVMIGLIAYLMYTSFTRWRSLQLESRMTDGVATAHGWVTKKRAQSRYRVSYHLEVNGSEFPISLAQFDSVIEGIEYRIHYAPLSRTILSLEPEESRGNQRGYFAERLGTL